MTARGGNLIAAGAHSDVGVAALLPVTTMRFLEPGEARQAVKLPAGLTIAEIVASQLPGLPDHLRSRVRVTLVTPKGEGLIPEEVWSRVRPHAGVHVIIRLVPGKEALRSVLTILVAIAAAAISSFFFPATFLGVPIGIAGLIGKTIVTLGIPAVGCLQVNALRSASISFGMPLEAVLNRATGAWRASPASGGHRLACPDRRAATIPALKALGEPL